MRRLPLSWPLALLLCLALADCNCGHGLPVGSTCAVNADCESLSCGAGHKCTGPKLPDGGVAGSGGSGGSGGTGGTGGTGGAGGSGGGSGVLPDGGVCYGLQCQVATCPAGKSTTVTGKVYDPGGNVPLYNAIVYVPNAALQPIPSGASCGACGSLISGNPVAIAVTAADGSFTLNNVPAGAAIPLVVQIGKWRRKVTLPIVPPCTNTAITDANVTRLPRNQSEGELPQMAISSGRADPFECLLRKIGISDSEFTTSAGSGRVHFFNENGLDLTSGAPAGSRLWTDGGTLLNYDVVILPCEGGANNKPNGAVRNFVNYTNAGGRVFATHYSYVWTRPGWPQSAAWQPGLPDLYTQVFDVTVNQSFPKGQAFAQWLVNVGASTTNGTLGLIETRHDVTAVNNGSTLWLSGNVPGSNPQESVQHLTFNTPFLDAGTLADGGSAPQCGRVVYSDFHVTAGATDGGRTFPDACAGGGLTGQEKALEFMLFDLSACVQNDKDVPMACGAVGQSCTTSAQCCSGLLCLDPAAKACTGAGCSCVAVIN